MDTQLWLSNYTYIKKYSCSQNLLVKHHIILFYRHLWNLSPAGRTVATSKDLSPEGSCDSRARMGSNCFYLYFNCCLGTYFDTFNFELVICLFKNLNLWWVDGWVVIFYRIWLSLFQVWKQATSAASKNGLKSCIRLLDKKLWAF